MPFCFNCGTRLEDGDKFCYKCGTRVEGPASPTQNNVNRQVQYAPVNGTVRYLCTNGHVSEGSDAQTACPTCGAPLQKGGYIHVYRMGNMMGMAVGMGIYVDNVPCGHIANKQTVCISVPYGQHKLHMTHTTTRTCNDPIYTITPQNPHVYCKAHFSSGGFTITIEQVTPDSMPR